MAAALVEWLPLPNNKSITANDKRFCTVVGLNRSLYSLGTTIYLSPSQCRSLETAVITTVNRGLSVGPTMIFRSHQGG